MKDCDWWRNAWQRNLKIKKKEGKIYEIWRIWWSICATRTKEKIR